MLKIWTALFFTVVPFAMTFVAQPPAGVVEAKKSEMRKLEKLVGEWKGAGWSQYGLKRETFTGGEVVQRKVDGLAILVEGKFIDVEGKVVHETLAVLACKPRSAGFDFMTFLANGAGGTYDFKTVGDNFEWGFEIPNFGTIRYTITVDDKTWIEIGELSRDGGKTWTKNFEMKLNRSPSK